MKLRLTLIFKLSKDLRDNLELEIWELSTVQLWDELQKLRNPLYNQFRDHKTLDTRCQGFYALPTQSDPQETKMTRNGNWYQLNNQLSDQLRSQLRIELHYQLHYQLSFNQLRDQLYYQLTDQNPFSQLRDQLYFQLKKQTNE